MALESRRDQLLELVRQYGFAALPDLASSLDVSESTVRRDLDALEKSGVAKRTHGGVFYTGPSPSVAHFQQRRSQDREKKRLIAERAALLVEDGDTVLLDGGSTTYELARQLVGRGIQVVTNSLPVANLFTQVGDHDLVFIGGYVHLRTGVSLGPYANEMLQRLNVRRSFLSVAGITERGYFNSHLLLVETEREMMRSADEIVVLADSSKFGRQSLALLCALGEVDQLVVDHEIPEHWRSCVSAAGVATLVAGPTDNG